MTANPSGNGRLAWRRACGAVELVRCSTASASLEVALRSGGTPPPVPAVEAVRDQAPADALISLRLGEALVRASRFAEAREALVGALVLLPGFSAAERALARVDLVLGHRDDAVARLLRLHRRRPGDGDMMTDIARAAAMDGRSDARHAWLMRAVNCDPESADALNNLAGAYHQQGDHGLAHALYERARRIAPRRIDVRVNLAALLTSMGRPAEALALWRRVPDSAEWRSRRAPGIAEAMAASGDRAGAVDLMRAHCEASPDDGEAWNAAAEVYRRAGLWSDAARAWRRAEMNGGLSGASLVNRSAALLAVGRHRAAAHVLALARERAGRIGETLDAGSADLLLRQYTGEDSRAATLRRHAAWGRLAARAVAELAVKPRSGALSRIAFVSPDLRFHPVAFFAEPLFEALSSHDVECIVYDTRGASDAYRDRLAGHTRAWHRVAGLSDAGLAARIRADGVDALVDLSGHTGGHRLGVFAHRIAPLQVSWLGYPDSTGLPTVDLRISDRWLDHEPDAARYYTETLARLPAGFSVYRPPDEAPPVGPLSDGRLRIGCLNSVTKFGAPMLQLVGTVMKTLPDAVLVLQGSGLDEHAGRRRLTRLLARVGVSEDRLELHGASGFEAHLALHSSCHVALDSTPWNGHTTSCHALWMGVPVVTLRGATPCARMGASVLERAGLERLVATDAEGVAARMAELEADRQGLASLRTGLRDALRASPLLDGGAFTRDFLDALGGAEVPNN